ncbi:MAG: hypothetical protein BroJett025_02210 [Patescibacteria group bacterium]|nr:MAG: hypothetical protein BroJett025_02210 [Patescibacteria group bacterium]
MSIGNEKLQALLEKVERLKGDQSLVTLLDAMGFFAFCELIEEAYETGKAVTQNLEAHAGAIVNTLRNMFQPGQRISRKTQVAFLGV